MRDVTEIWQRIKAHQGEEFRTKTGLPFTYDVAGNMIVVSRSPTYPFPVSQVEKALERAEEKILQDARPSRDNVVELASRRL